MITITKTIAAANGHIEIAVRIAEKGENQYHPGPDSVIRQLREAADSIEKIATVIKASR